MLQRGIMVGKEPLVRWHADDDAAARLQDASHLRQSSGIVLYMLQNIRRDYHVKRSIPKWQPKPIGAAVEGSTPLLRQPNGVWVRFHPND
jgi:hypothetical protein